MTDDYLIRHCAPTLAGIKTASLFTCPFASREELLESVRQINARLGGKGVRVVPLRFSENRALIYLYRPQKLTADLSREEASRLLTKCGYPAGSCRQCVGCLARKLQQQSEFPHEIGLFLGYPPEDVRGFMEHGPDQCKCTGCWKVYGDEEAAKRTFAQYKKCTSVYCRQWAEGKDIERLTVSAKPVDIPNPIHYERLNTT